MEVLDDRQTGETILDEALRMMKAQEQERMAVNSWIDLLSGEYRCPTVSRHRSLTGNLPRNPAFQARHGT